MSDAEGLLGLGSSEWFGAVREAVSEQMRGSKKGAKKMRADGPEPDELNEL